MDQVQCILDHDGSESILSLEELADLGRKSLRKVLCNPPLRLSLDEIERLWLRLQRTACSSAVIDGHLTAACNAVCVFLLCACRSESQEVRQYAFSRQVWFQAFGLVHKAFGDGKTKPASHVLETLIQVLRENEAKEQSRANLKATIAEMVKIIFTSHPRIRLKEACIVLSSFLKQTGDIVPDTEYLESYDLRLQTAFRRRFRQADFEGRHLDSVSQHSLEHFLLALLLTSSISESKTAAIKLFSLLCSKTEKIDLSSNVDSASAAMEIYLQANPEALQDLSMDHFPSIINHMNQLQKFLERFNPAEAYSESRLSAFLVVIGVGRRKGLLKENDLPRIVTAAVSPENLATSTENNEYFGFENILTCNTSNIRLQAFHLLTMSTATNARVSRGVLSCISRSLRCLHDESDASYRDQYVSICRRFIARLERSREAKWSHEVKDTSPNSKEDVDYANFLQHWYSFLLAELSPQASYQRHILTLQILCHLTPLLLSYKEAAMVDKVSKSLLMALLNLMFNPFDDVRPLAASLLITLASFDNALVSSTLESLRVVEFGKLISATTNRADHADALGRLYMLQSCLYDEYVQPETAMDDRLLPTHHTVRNLIELVLAHLDQSSRLSPLSRFPLHGSILGLTYATRLSDNSMLQLHPSVASDLLRICDRVWRFVQRDLCIDSPETEAGEDDHDVPSGPKDLLAYSWRALRDSRYDAVHLSDYLSCSLAYMNSLLMQALLDKVTTDTVVYQSVGELCLDQLTSLRHRGAFSTVAQTFLLCCQKSRAAGDEGCRTLSLSWLEAAYTEIEAQSSKLTRRSAGIPSMFAALLDPNDPKQFNAGVRRLAEIARKHPVSKRSIAAGSLRLPQVHALNCLKDIATNSRFRVMTESLVVEMLNLAAHSLSSDIWEIQNCGLMLFRACVGRLTLDSSNAHETPEYALNIAEVKTPLALAVNLLTNQQVSLGIEDEVLSVDAGSKRSEIQFAALELLSKIPVQLQNYQVIEDLVTTQLGSKLWAVREHAARFKASMAPFERETAVRDQSMCWIHEFSANQAHGHFLSSLYALENQWVQMSVEEREKQTQVSVNNLVQYISATKSFRYHPIVFSASLDLLNEIFASALFHDCPTGAILECCNLVRNVSANQPNLLDFFLLRRGFALNSALVRICNLGITHHNVGQVPEQDLVLLHLMAEGDVALYTISYIARKLSSSPRAQVFLLLLEMVSVCQAPEARASLLLSLSQHISGQEDRETAIKLKKVVETIDLQKAESRTLWSAQIRFVAGVTRLCLKYEPSLTTDMLDILVAALRISQRDEIETVTRMIAVEAAAEIAPSLIAVDKACAVEDGQICLRILLVLYDFLNDDEEEVRKIAAEATNQIRQKNTKQSCAIVSCAVASREILLGIMLTGHNASTRLLGNAYVRILGINNTVGFMEAESIVAFCQANPVSMAIRIVVQRANDLFVEERQNLYIDDVAEIEGWANAVRQCCSGGLEQDTQQILHSWATQGLEYLTVLIKSDARKSSVPDGNNAGDEPELAASMNVHPLGLTYNTEALTIFVRVITIAGLLRYCHKVNAAQHNLTLTQLQPVTSQLQTLQILSQTDLVHRYIRTSLRNSLRE